MIYLNRIHKGRTWQNHHLIEALYDTSSGRKVWDIIEGAWKTKHGYESDSYNITYPSMKAWKAAVKKRLAEKHKNQ